MTVPLKAYRQVPVEPLRGKVVIDTNNYYPQRDGHIAELDDESTTISELLQAHLPESQVVKAFNNIYVGHLASLQRPAGDPERSVLAIAGDDAGGQADGRPSSSTRIGYDTVDAARSPRAGASSATPRRTCMPYAVPGPDAPTGPGQQVTRATLTEKLGAAVRYRDM